MNPNSKSAGNAQWFQLPETVPYHREVVSRGGQQAFVRPSDGCADAEASLAGPYPADACRPPSVPCGVGAGPTRWPAIPTWQRPDGHAPPPTRTSPAIRRPPRMGTRWPIHLLPTGKPLRGETASRHHNHCIEVIESVTPLSLHAYAVRTFRARHYPSVPDTWHATNTP